MTIKVYNDDGKISVREIISTSGNSESFCELVPDLKSGEVVTIDIPIVETSHPMRVAIENFYE